MLYFHLFIIINGDFVRLHFHSGIFQSRWIDGELIPTWTASK